MNRNESTTIKQLLGAIHSRREPRLPSPAWRRSVMSEIGSAASFDTPETDFERLAPRFTLAAATLSLLLMATASWTLHSLPGQIYSAYTSQMLTFIPTALTSM